MQGYNLMFIIIENINFGKSHIHLRTLGCMDPKSVRRLAAFFKKCRSLYLNDIAIQIPNDISDESLSLLTNLAASSNVSIVYDNHCRYDTDIDSNNYAKLTHYLIEPSHGDSEYNHAYVFCTSNLQNAIEQMQIVVAVVSDAMDLGDDIYYRLKLCIHEMAANSTEHGVFDPASPSISLSIKIDKDYLYICYRDNAEKFNPILHQTIDINEKIRAKNTRGYGLFIMNCLTTDLRYRRVMNANQTTFKIRRSGINTGPEQRRSAMEQFSIKLVNCDIDNTMIVKPIGSVDSMTTQSVEEKLIALIDSGTKYIVVDFSEITFISSAGIGVLLGTVSTLREEGGDLILMRIPPEIKEIFDILNISDYFLSVDSISELKDTIHSKA
jgi:anti-anti-sigma factor